MNPENRDPCWKGYEMVGMKDKNGKQVPNCVPKPKKDTKKGKKVNSVRNTNA